MKQGKQRKRLHGGCMIDYGFSIIHFGSRSKEVFCKKCECKDCIMCIIRNIDNADIVK